MVALAARRSSPVAWFARLNAAVSSLGTGMPMSRPILHEQPDDPGVPLLRELFFPARRVQVRVVFHFDEARVRVVHARSATARPLTEAQVRRFARR